MASINVHAGDFGEGKALLKTDTILLPIKKGQGRLNRDKLKITDITSLDIATEESVKRIAGTAGWGTAGALLLGPAGLLAGLILGGKKSEVTFIAQVNDQTLLATTEMKIYKKLMAAIY